ncbi:hypothetical protein [Streptomyces sp. 8L]|uniref:hypothetical protein n=1 Tax=Streptomyces sp. 8L TaxID=2877242 RepID=UPI001CD547AE|nr:hypothetical protein [Streptomyces sp. 8L]MCA1218577.1 hypothetical protein [Streptomyces sp. 8L]
MSAESGSRALRAAVFAAVSVLLGAIGHELMSDQPLPWWAVAGALWGTGAVAWLCAGREERTMPRVVGLTVAVQAALHGLFSLAQSLTSPPAPRPTSFGLLWAQYLTCGLDTNSLTAREATRMVVEAGLGDHLSTPPPGMASMSMPMPMPASGGMEGMGGTGGMGGMGGMHGGMAMGVLPHGTAGLGMLAAHLLAALVCGLWLAHGERAAFRLLRVLAQWLHAPLSLPGLYRAASLERPAPLRRFDDAVAGPRLPLLTNCVITRGPPVSTAVL